MPSVDTVDGFPLPVSVAGPERGPAVVLLSAARLVPSAYDAICKRLHTARLRTIVVGHDPRLTAKSVIGVLDSLDVQWGVVFGDRLGGGELAWQLAATKLNRFIGLIVVDRGHPRVADPRDGARDEHCPPVEINTTMVVTTSAALQAARASERFVHSDFRLVELIARPGAPESTAQLAAEIVLRTSTW